MLRKPLGGRGREWATESLKLLEAMLELDDSKNFRQPLEPVTYPEYYSMISNPIDLSKVMLKFHGGSYMTLAEFAADMRGMFDNYKKFFSDPSSEKYSEVHRLSWWFEGEYSRIKQKWGKDAPRPHPRAGCPILPKRAETATKRFQFTRPSGGGRKRTTLDERIRMLRECNRVSEYATRKAIDPSTPDPSTSETEDVNTNIILSIKHGTCTIVPGKEDPGNRTCVSSPGAAAAAAACAVKPRADPPSMAAVSAPQAAANNSDGGSALGHSRKRGMGGPNDPGPPRRIPRFLNNQGAPYFRPSAHLGMMLKIETNNIWFGSSRYKPRDPVTLTEEGFQIPIRHNDQDIVFSIKSEAVIRCAANFSRARKHTLFLFVLPSCTAELHRVFGNDFSSSNNMFVLFLRPLVQSEISQMIHIFWNMSKNSMFGQLFSEVDQRSALALLANIKPAILNRLPDGLRRGRGCRGMGRGGVRMPWPMHQAMEFDGVGSEQSFFPHPPMGMHAPVLHSQAPPQQQQLHPPFVPFGAVYSDPRAVFAEIPGYVGEEGEPTPNTNSCRKDPQPTRKSPTNPDDSDTLFEDFGGVEEENGKDQSSGDIEDSAEVIDEGSDLEIVIPSDSEDDEKEQKLKTAKVKATPKADGDDIVMTSEKISIKCPITQKVMKYPIKNKHCGHCYDREGIEELIKHRGEKARCPVPGCSNHTPLNCKDMLYEYNLWKHIQAKLNPTDPNFLIK